MAASNPPMVSSGNGENDLVSGFDDECDGQGIHIIAGSSRKRKIEEDTNGSQKRLEN